MSATAPHRGDVLRRLRSKRRRLVSGVLALFGAVWLNMALQPCLMAAEPILPAQHHESGCPHCPPTDSHCGDQAAGRCTYIASIDFDGRQHAPGVDSDTFKLAAAAPAPLPISLDPVRACTIAVTGDPSPGHTGPPLFVRHCRYLK